ncbi:AzlC family ABC transporter permease [soil metagenome]
MSFDRSTFVLGVRDGAPMLVGAIPFGLITGVSAVSVGIDPVAVVYMSATVFAGAAQIAAISLVGTGAAMWVVLLTTVMINLRHVMYSASLAPWLGRYTVGERLAMAFVLIDQTYALSILRYPKEGTAFSRRDYILGIGATTWLVWVGATAVGALLGAQVPAAWQLDFAIPLLFLALLVPALRSRPTLLAALTGGSTALALAGLPFNLGLVLAALTGIAAGALAESWQTRSEA